MNRRKKARRQISGKGVRSTKAARDVGSIPKEEKSPKLPKRKIKVEARL